VTSAAAPDLAAPPCAVPGTPLADALPGIMTCVHCGFCLQACPTYRALGDENDSPRGRILLMRSVVEGELDLHDESFRTHIDRCLGCRGCETACPSGVPYGQLLEAARETMVTEGRPLPLMARAILFVFARPALLRLAMAAGRMLRATRIPALLARLPGRLGQPMAMLAATTPALPERPYTRRGSGARGTVALLEGCVMDGLFGHVNRATARTLRANGHALVEAPGQRCCGALHAHAGDADTARALARRNIEAFERSGAEHIAVNSAGCGAMMKEYGHLLHDDPAWAARASALAAKVRDASELLAAAGPLAGAPVERTVTYDAPCHLLHAQRIVRPPLAVLAAVPGLTVVPLTDADQCCGAAGIYNLIEPGTSEAVLDPKLRNIAETGAALVATGNPGCHMQIGGGLARAGLPARVVHPVELLDASYAGE
jgi:glycolate oxidase iron-sulfur subunit